MKQRQPIEKLLRTFSLLLLAFSVLFLTENIKAQNKSPKTVREFFNLLPQKYFPLEGCEPKTDRNCERARREYVQNYLEVDDAANGYLRGACDGAQSCLEMALFKRPDGTYIVGLGTFNEMMNDYYFLEYRNGQWFDVSTKVVPQFSKKNMYEFPRYGTTVKVFAKKILKTGNEYGDKFEISEKGAKLYDLVWSSGKFTVKR